MRTRNKWLEGLQVVTVLVSGLLGLALVALVVTAVSGALGKPIPIADVEVEVPVGDLDATPPPGTEFTWGVDVLITDPTPTQYLLNGVSTITGCALLLAGAVLLYRVLKAAVLEPFSRTVAARLRALGMLGVLGALVQALVDSVTGMLLVRSVLHDDGLAMVYTPSLGTLLFGVGMLAAAGIIRRGVVMRDELEGTI